MGVGFTDTISVRDEIPGSLGRLHRIWLECAGREARRLSGA